MLWGWNLACILYMIDKYDNFTFRPMWIHTHTHAHTHASMHVHIHVMCMH